MDESNLRVQIATLRKALSDGEHGARYISNVAGRGYCFVISVANALLNGFPGAVCFVDLSVLTNPQLVPTAVASALGFMIQARDPFGSLVAFIGDKKILLILDNC